jgi:hypothetical protein
MNNISLLQILLTGYFIENILARNKSSYITPFREHVKHAVPKAVSEFNGEGHQTNYREKLSASPERRCYSLVVYTRPLLGITIHFTVFGVTVYLDDAGSRSALTVLSPLDFSLKTMKYGLQYIRTLFRKNTEMFALNCVTILYEELTKWCFGSIKQNRIY